MPNLVSVAEEALKIKPGYRYGYEFPDVWKGENELSVRLRFDGVDPTDMKPYQFECTFEYNLDNGATSKFEVVTKTLFEG